MINRRLTTAEAAERLGIKPATLYSYVSRGLLHPERTPRGSLFDLQEVVQLSRSARHPGGPGHHAPRPVRGRPSGPEPVQEVPIFVTELTLIDQGRLYYRGEDAVDLSRSRSFEEVASWLWTGGWGEGEPSWTVPASMALVLSGALAALGPGVTPLERFMVAIVSGALCDDLRHDLNPAGVPVTGRALVALLAAALPGARDRRLRSHGGPVPSIARRVWDGLALRPAGNRPDAEAISAAGVTAMDAALVLAADHELAPSTLAARVAASFRADPYAVVLTGLGPASGSWYAGSTGAPSEVERLLREAHRLGPERAIGERLRRGEDVPHGFGMPLYPDGDPRAAELLGRLEHVGAPERLDLVHRLLEVGAERGFPPPNFDLGLGALAYCAGMDLGAGQAIFTLGKVAGWLAHAIEEYTSPTRFRSRADYVGAIPDS
ncbi:MAG: citrate synthase [Actinomycetota bacterium]|nr:citrate synthase [Actinomycetota bacterium]